jgi:hypothetical protein
MVVTGRIVCAVDLLAIQRADCAALVLGLFLTHAIDDAHLKSAGTTATRPSCHRVPQTPCRRRDSYSRRVYDGGAPELDFGSPRNLSVFYASADVKNSTMTRTLSSTRFFKVHCTGSNSARRSPSHNPSCAAIPWVISGPSATRRAELWSSMQGSKKA